MYAVHNIQRKILGKLLYAESLAYAQIRPPGVESNHFAYHLEQLVRAGLVGKKDKRYFLAPDGLAAVDRMSQAKMVARLQPQIVTAIDLTNSKGETLLYKRNFQPYFHRIGHPLGKTHFEETVMQAAARELMEKSGLEGVTLTHRGMAYIESRQDGFTISRVLYHIFSGVSDAEPIQTNPQRGSSFWADPSHYTDKELMPGFRNIQQLLATEENLFFAEITAELSPSTATA